MIKAEKKKTKPKIEINLQQVEKLAANGLTQQQIADSLGISVSTIESRLRESEEFKDAIKKGKAKGIAIIANQLFEKAQSGDTTSIIFYLKTQGGWKESQVVESKISLVDEVALLMEEISSEAN
ncbi:winged helix-turn-helix transcriptional regulator [Gilliamella sp. B2828]|uniref:winged helix-turn-helix transcriptional regulator n=1 Tax=Gilliamella sp. B2828 TaxID=2817974 RepID=UPI002269C7C1|nr:winged helix-turn-helix transcriptional regulator [Gilliamella sp. B2828]MCX8696552.1 winged helix-turn-helix transcriptional regulator [Gilliamella sp. B2828]